MTNVPAKSDAERFRVEHNGPPAQHLIAGAADWYEERGCDVEAGVLRDLAKGGGE